MNPTLAQVVSCGLSLLLFVSNTVLAHSLEANIWAERQSRVAQAIPTASLELLNLPRASFHLSTLAPSLLEFMPPALGSVRHVSRPENKRSGKTVIYIQDVHLNAEAQRNIGHVVQNLLRGRQLGLIALEGAFGKIDLS